MLFMKNRFFTKIAFCFLLFFLFVSVSSIVPKTTFAVQIPKIKVQGKIVSDVQEYQNDWYNGYIFELVVIKTDPAVSHISGDPYFLFSYIYVGSDRYINLKQGDYVEVYGEETFISDDSAHGRTVWAHGHDINKIDDIDYCEGIMLNVTEPAIHHSFSTLVDFDIFWNGHYESENFLWEDPPRIRFYYSEDRTFGYHTKNEIYTDTADYIYQEGKFGGSRRIIDEWPYGKYHILAVIEDKFTGCVIYDYAPGNTNVSPPPGDDTPPSGDDTPPPGDDTPPPGDDTPPPGDDTPPPEDDSHRFIDNNDGTVTDTELSLMWQKCSYGQSWKINGSTEECVGSAVKSKFFEAEDLAKNLTLAGYSDWHLPYTYHLYQLVDNDQYPTIYSIFVGSTMPSHYWSDGTQTGSATSGTVNFKNGGLSNTNVNESHFFRASRFINGEEEDEKGEEAEWQVTIIHSNDNKYEPFYIHGEEVTVIMEIINEGYPEDMAATINVAKIDEDGNIDIIYNSHDEKADVWVPAGQEIAKFSFRIPDKAKTGQYALLGAVRDISWMEGNPKAQVLDVTGGGANSDFEGKTSWIKNIFQINEISSALDIEYVEIMIKHDNNTRDNPYGDSSKSHILPWVQVGTTNDDPILVRVKLDNRSKRDFSDLKLKAVFDPVVFLPKENSGQTSGVQPITAIQLRYNKHDLFNIDHESNIIPHHGDTDIQRSRLGPIIQIIHSTDFIPDRWAQYNFNGRDQWYTPYNLEIHIKHDKASDYRILGSYDGSSYTNAKSLRYSYNGVSKSPVSPYAIHFVDVKYGRFDKFVKSYNLMPPLESFFVHSDSCMQGIWYNYVGLEDKDDKAYKGFLSDHIHQKLKDVKNVYYTLKKIKGLIIGHTTTLEESVDAMEAITDGISCLLGSEDNSGSKLMEKYNKCRVVWKDCLEQCKTGYNDEVKYINNMYRINFINHCNNENDENCEQCNCYDDQGAIIESCPINQSEGGNITHNGQTVGPASTFYNNSNYASVIVEYGGTLNNNSLLSDLVNRGTLNGGSVSGNSLNRGTLNQVEIVPDTILDNAKGTISGGVNNGNVFGGTISGQFDNNGTLSGTVSDGTKDPDYELVIETGAVINGGAMDGIIVNKGTLEDVYFDAGASIRFLPWSEGEPGRLAGTISFTNPSGVVFVIVIPSDAVFPDPDTLGEDGLILYAQNILDYAWDNEWDIDVKMAASPLNEEPIVSVPDGYFLVGGTVLSDKGAQSIASVDFFVPYEPWEIPEGYAKEDLSVLVYDYAKKQWDIVPSENTGNDTLKISTSRISAYAVVLEVDEPPDENGDDPHDPEESNDEDDLDDPDDLKDEKSSSSSGCFVDTLKSG